MSKQYMTITNNSGEETVTIKTNSDKAIKMAIKKLYSGLIGDGAVKTIEIKGNVIKFTYTEEAAYWGYWQPTSTGRVYIVENTFVTEETAEVIDAPAAEVVEAPVAEVVEVEAEAPVAEVIDAEAHTVTMSVEEKRAAWDIFVKEWAKSRAAYIRGDAEAPARIVEDVDASYDDDAIDEALDAIRDAIISGRSYAHLIETAQDLGATRHAITEVITEATASLA